MTIGTVRINGAMHSWSSVEFRIDGEDFVGFTSIDYGDKRDRVKAWGQGRSHAPKGVSAGKYEADNVKLTCWKGDLQELRRRLAQKASDGTSYGNVFFYMTLQFIEADDKPLCVEFLKCWMTTNHAGHEESPDPLKEDVEIGVSAIKRNGLTLFDNTERRY